MIVKVLNTALVVAMLMYIMMSISYFIQMYNVCIYVMFYLFFGFGIRGVC
jgi:hypothetical protein